MPLSQGELAGHTEQFASRLLAEPASLVDDEPSTTIRDEYIERVCAGGFPMAADRSATGRNRWFDNYLALTLERDVRGLARTRQREKLPMLLARMAAQTAQVLSVSKAGADFGLSQSSADEYTKLLEAVFLSPAKLAARDATALQQFGHLLETFAVGELRKQLSWTEGAAVVGHWRTHDGVEVDLVIEGEDGGVAAVEIKASSRVRGSDLRGLQLLRDKLGPRFIGGIPLYTGQRAYTAGDRIHVLPLDRLWAR